MFVKYILAMQLKKYCIKGFPLYAIHVTSSTRDNKLNIDYYLMLQEYNDVFSKEILGFFPKKDIDLSIEVTRSTMPISTTQ